MKDKVLVIEDDSAIAKGLLYNLEYEGFEVRHASHGAAAIPVFEEFQPDLVVLDVMLPGRSGFEILQDIRANDPCVQIIILSAKTNESDKVFGLSHGADDYVAKPFSLREFLARIHAAMRRRHIAQHVTPITLGNLTIDPQTKLVSRQGQPLKFTPKALELLMFFVKHPNRIFTREQLIEHIWGNDYEGTTRTIDNFILQIRTQIEENPAKPKFLETVHGLGYRFLN